MIAFDKNKKYNVLRFVTIKINVVQAKLTDTILVQCCRRWHY